MYSRLLLLRSATILAEDCRRLEGFKSGEGALGPVSARYPSGGLGDLLTRMYS